MSNYDELDKKINESIKLIKKQYLSTDENYPWLIGYSGGKDSTCAAQLVFKSLMELKESGYELKRDVTIFSSDTLIENPLVKQIIQKNMILINKTAAEYKLPIRGVVLAPTIENTFWVNVIGKGYPTPNTMFRWCTDRMKILPADVFVKQNIDKNGEVIMVLGVREGESGTRDRVLKSHNIEGETLMKHTTMSNAYVFAPIKNFGTRDVFLYLGSKESPWGSNNKELYFFYEESGAGECPIFLSQQDKTSSNSCGNSRMGCWCCTVVTKDKSLSGFIETGWHDELKPLLEFRNWLASIRDNEDYRCFYRMNGSVYTKRLETKTIDNNVFVLVGGKDRTRSVMIPVNKNGTISKTTGYTLVEKDALSEYMKNEGLTFKDPRMAKIILIDNITQEFFKIGTGPFNDKAKIEIFQKLMVAEQKYNELSAEKTHLISDEEINEIKKYWLKSSIDLSIIDEAMDKSLRNRTDFVQDSFEVMNQKYMKDLEIILKEKHLDVEILSLLVQNERECINKNKKEEMQGIIASIFEADKNNYQ